MEWIEIIELVLASFAVMIVLSIMAFRWRKERGKKRPYLWFDMVILSVVFGFLIMFLFWMLKENGAIPEDISNSIGDAEIYNP